MQSKRSREFSGSEFDLAEGSVYGLRWWNGRGKFLKGFHGYFWSASENFAICRCPGYSRRQVQSTAPFNHSGEATSHDIFSKKCRGGFYAYWDLEYCPFPRDMAVLGVVQGYGRVVVGSKGFRAERSKIAALYVPDPNKISVSHLEKVYGVPVYHSVHDLVANHPLTGYYAPGLDSMQISELDKDLSEVLYSRRVFYISLILTFIMIAVASGAMVYGLVMYVWWSLHLAGLT